MAVESASKTRIKGLSIGRWLHLLSQRKILVFKILTALAILFFANGLLIVLVKGFIKGFFVDQNVSSIYLRDLVSEKSFSLFGIAHDYSFEKGKLILIIPLSLIFFAAIKSFSTYLFELTKYELSFLNSQYLREEIFAKLLNLSFLDVSRTSPGGWMSRLMNDVSFVEARLTDMIAGFLRGGISVISALVFLAWLHYPSAIVLCIFAPIIAYSMGSIGKSISFYTKFFQAEMAQLAETFLDFRRNFLMIKAQHAEAYELNRFVKSNDQYFAMMKKSILLRAAFAPGLEWVAFLLLAGFIYAYGNTSLSQSLPQEHLLHFFVALGLVLKPLKDIGEQVSRLHETQATLHSIHELTSNNFSSSSRNPANTSASPATQSNHLNIGHLSVKLASKTLLNVSDLIFTPQVPTAVIGLSGAGKSTLLKVFAGLISPADLKINADFEDIKSQTSYVSQTPFLFRGTLRENLIYGLKHSVADEQIWEALKLVEMESEMRQLSDQLDFKFDALSEKLSGGQKQRLTIARGVLRNHSFLLLDEALSAVDTSMEQKILANLLSRYLNTKVLLSVTHRLDYLSYFKQIIFIDEGVCIFKGAFEEILRFEPYEKLTQSLKTVVS